MAAALRQTVAKGCQIARPAPVQRKPRQRAFDVGALPQGGPNIVSDPPVRDEMGHRIMPPGDLPGIGRGA